VHLEGSISPAQFLGHSWFVYIGNFFWLCIGIGFFFFNQSLLLPISL